MATSVKRRLEVLIEEFQKLVGSLPGVSGKRDKWWSDAMVVYIEWKVHHSKAPEKLRSGSKEYKKIVERLKEGYTVDQLRLAIYGMHLSPHHLGENERKTKYLSLELCMRDSDHVQKFIEIADDPPKLSPKTREPRIPEGATWIDPHQTQSLASGHDYGLQATGQVRFWQQKVFIDMGPFGGYVTRRPSRDQHPEVYEFTEPATGVTAKTRRLFPPSKEKTNG